MIRFRFRSLAAALMLAATSAPALAQGTAFTYQGQLQNAGSAVNTPTDFRFSLFTAATGGTQVGSTITRNAIAVANGLFSTPVDFGVDPYTANRTLFLQIDVRNPAGSGAFVPLGSRQPLTPAPFSLATRGLSVASDGKIGLGVNTPLNQIDVPNAAVIGPSTLFGSDANDPANRGTKLALGWNTSDNSCGPVFAGMKVDVLPSEICGNATDLTFWTAECGVSCSREVLRVKGNGALGLGTSAPASKLHVVGSGASTDSLAPYLILETAPGGLFRDNFLGPQIRLKHTGPSGQDWVLVSCGTGNGTPGSFGLIRQGADSFAFAADPLGWAGIGRGTPITGFTNEAFSIANKPLNTTFNGMVIDSAAVTGSAFYGYAVNQDLKGRTSVNASGDFDLWLAGSSRMKVLGNGNVGIGIGSSTPIARLDVSGGQPGFRFPAAVFRIDSCGVACAQEDFAEAARLVNLTPNGRVGLGFMLRPNPAANSVSDVWIGTGNGADPGDGSNDFIIATRTGPTALTNRLRLNGDSGNLGIGTDLPDQRLSVNGNASKTGGGSWAVLSDQRTKNNIQPMIGTLDRLLKLKGHAYSYKPEFVHDGRALPGTQIGLVAQEVEAVFPDWVSTGPDGLKQVTERATTALMVEALRDLRAEKDAQIAQRDAELAQLKARLERLEALLNASASPK